VTAHFCRKILEGVGIRSDRLALDWASAAEAPLYVALITNFTKHIKELGPLGKADGLSGEELSSRLSVARSAVKSVKLRTRFARLTQALREANDYSPQLIESKMAENFDQAILREMEKQEKLLSEAGVGVQHIGESIDDNKA
jgi:F420-non-reducing hydrogenase iron-sulfur subunit